MAIPENQLQTWANQGAVDSAQKTHVSLRNALDAYKKWPAGVTYDTYLQGSYRNTTNIRGDSDVDIVVELTSVQYSNLNDGEKVLLKLEPAAYKWSDFRTDVIAALSEYYGNQLIDTTGKKSIKVLPSSGRLKADVVVAATYRYYENTKVRADGITFFTIPDWQQIVNYPKLHYDNGADKNSDQKTHGWYKPTIRTYKNARNNLVEGKLLLKNRFPSYFIECLLYNVPDSKFGGTCQANFTDTINWLSNELYTEQANKFVCQNGMFYLFGTSSVQWNVSDAQEYVSQLVELWNNW